VLGLEGNTPLHHAALEGHYKVGGEESRAGKNRRSLVVCSVYRLCTLIERGQYAILHQ
jgi:hypothetical protein